MDSTIQHELLLLRSPGDVDSDWMVNGWKLATITLLLFSEVTFKMLILTFVNAF